MKDLAPHPRHKQRGPVCHQREREGECLLTTLYKLMHQRSNIICPENPLTMANQSWKRRKPSAPLCQRWPTYTHIGKSLWNSLVHTYHTTQQMYTWTLSLGKWKLVFTHKPMHMFTAALFMMAPNWNQSKRPSTSESEQVTATCAVEHYTEVKRKNDCSCSNLDGSETSYIEGKNAVSKVTWYMIALLENSWKNSVTGKENRWATASQSGCEYTGVAWGRSCGDEASLYLSLEQVCILITLVVTWVYTGIKGQRVTRMHTHTHVQSWWKLDKFWMSHINISFLVSDYPVVYIRCYLWEKLGEGFTRTLVNIFYNFLWSIIIPK